MNFENTAGLGGEKKFSQAHRNEIGAPSSRLTDEKISDESGTETTADRAMAPAGLKNPFWN